MKQPKDASPELDVERLRRDPSYREAMARELLARAGQDADHVQLRRAARRAFPRLEREAGRRLVGRLVGAAATLRKAGRADATGRPEGRSDEHGPRGREDGGAEGAEPDPRLTYPSRYADLGLEERNRLIRFCDSQLQEGSEGREALSAVREEFGWPYPDRTFYVGPWKAARMRRRKIDRRRAARAEAERVARASARTDGRSSQAPSRSRSAERKRNGASAIPSTSAGRHGRHSEAADLPLEGEEKGEVEISTPRARYRAVRQEGGEWEVTVRARVDGRAMRRLFADAVDVLFPGGTPASGRSPANKGRAGGPED